MYIERIIKLQIPIEPSQSGLSYFEEVVKKHGRRITMQEINGLLEDRFGAQMYIDANVFIFAALDNGDTGNAARTLLRRIENKEINAVVSPLVFDEVIWIVQRISGREDAKKIGQGLLSLPISWVDIGYTSIKNAMIYYDEGLNPRDAIHVGVMTDYNINIIISEDKDFDKVQTIKRKTIGQVLKELDERNNSGHH